MSTLRRDHLAETIARDHYEADASQLAAGDTIQTTMPVAWMTGASTIMDEIDARTFPVRYHGDPDELAEEVRKHYRRMVEETR